MALHVTYAEARRDLARPWDLAVQDRETIIVGRSGAEDVALIAADELASLQEAAHLLRSPANAASLRAAIQRELEGEQPASSLDELKREVGLADEA